MDTDEPVPELNSTDLRQLRSDLGLTQRLLAKAIGVSAGYIALLESGARTVSPDVARRLMRLRRHIPALAGAPGRSERLSDDPAASDLATTSDDLPFTILIGPSGDARRHQARLWVEKLARATSGRVIWIDLASTSIEGVQEALAGGGGDTLVRSGDDIVIADRAVDAADAILDRLEASGQPPAIVVGDEWNPRSAGAHRVMAELGVLARRARVVLITDASPPAIPGVAVVPLAMSPEGSVAEVGSIDEPPSAGVASLLSASVEHLQREPVLWLQRLNLLLDRGRDADIAQAQAELRLMLGQFAGEGLRWQLLTLGCELALRANDYIGAQAHIEELTELHNASAGSFDLTPVLIFQARVSWERGSYSAALDDLSKTNPLRPDDACRVANWRARSLAALGDIAGALQASESGRRTADQFDLQGGLAYSLALSGQYELYRGNMIRGRRHLDRALHVSGEAQELRVRPQILTTLAEVDLLEGRLEDARNRMSEALHALAARPRRIWDSAYWSLTQARIHRRSLDWDAACSAARTLAYEAGFVSTKAPRHPVVSALHAEAATCWMAAGYEHQASLALADVDWSPSDWVTLLQRDLVLTVVSTEDPEVYASRADSILQRAIQGGAPYVAVEMAFELAVRANRRWSWLAADLASWTYSAAESRGWKRVSRAAAPIAAGRGGPVDETRGSIVRDSRGVSTLFAPPRGQRPARGESAPPLPDPFDRESTS